MSVSTTTLARSLSAHMKAAGAPCSARLAKEAIMHLFNEIGGAVKSGEVVRIKDFGTFRLRVTKAGKRTIFGKTYNVKAKKTLRFRASTKF